MPPKLTLESEEKIALVNIEKHHASVIPRSSTCKTGEEIPRPKHERTGTEILANSSHYEIVESIVSFSDFLYYSNIQWLRVFHNHQRIYTKNWILTFNLPPLEEHLCHQWETKIESIRIPSHWIGANFQINLARGQLKKICSIISKSSPHIQQKDLLGYLW